ncbi:MAG: hydantoinase B/oxoprolinase family protein, partial [Emcibacter sp.]|nr:hydantoinase B/oxoprolinase family protein [Emcibacter sp.]
AASQTISRPWAMEGGQEGSNNYALILRKDGKVERHHMCTGIAVEKGEVVRLYTGTGGGYGDPKRRPKAQVLSDIKNGYITEKQAADFYFLT